MHITIKQEEFPLANDFIISRGSRSSADVIKVTISDGKNVGMGECLPYKRYNETIELVAKQIQSVNVPVNRQELLQILPAGAARNALDCALWDFESKLNEVPVWKLAKLEPPRKVVTAYTISLQSPEEMYEKALVHRNRPILKLKLGGNEDLDRIEAVRKAAPNSQLIIDANEAFTIDLLDNLMSDLVRLRVDMIEQPLVAGDDKQLIEYQSSIPICADESCHDVQSLDDLENKYDMINIKLDKSGGLTEAIQLLKEAKKRKFEVMVGCMVGSSLGIAPALLLAPSAKLVDLDAPLLLSKDRENPIEYDESTIFPPPANLWGYNE